MYFQIFDNLARKLKYAYSTAEKQNIENLKKEKKNVRNNYRYFISSLVNRFGWRTDTRWIFAFTFVDRACRLRS